MDSPCIKQTVCKVLNTFKHGKYLVAYVLNFINLHNMVLKYDIHLNRMSNYIIHSFYVVMGSLLDNIFTMNALQY